MKMVMYKFFATDSKDDIERAVLPTLIVARKQEGMAVAHSIAIGWWRWGVGVIRTVINDRSL